MVFIRRYASNWRSYLALGGLGLIIGRLLNDDRIPNQRDKKSHETNAAREYGDYLYKKVVPPYTPNEGWHPDEKSHRSKERRYWWCSIALSVLTLFGAVAATYFAGKAFVQTKRQADYAQEQLGEAKADNRPWIAILVDNTPLKVGTQFQISVQYSNVGHSPALKARMWGTLIPVMKNGSPPLPATYIPTDTANAKAYGALLPGQGSSSFVQFKIGSNPYQISMTPTQAEVDSVTNGGFSLWLLARAEYTDTGGRPCYSRIRGVFDPVAGTFVWTDSGNDAD